MPVIDITKDVDTRSLTITATFAAPVQRVWQVYADPRQLERVWGPPSYPATFEAHSLAVGGEAHYFMTGPDGEKFHGIWRITDVDEPTSFAFDDFFADAQYTPASSMPAGHNVYTFTEQDGQTLATYVARYASAEDLQKVLDMGMEEGSREAINQIDTLLAG